VPSPSQSSFVVPLDTDPLGPHVRRTLTLLLIGLLALSTLALAPASSSGADADAGPVVCVRFRDYTVPFTDITYEPEYQRLCVVTPSVPNPTART
jgi:hypothetical protein